MQEIRDLVSEQFDDVNQLIAQQLNSDVALIEQISQYIVQAGGKRLRPLLVLLTAKALGNYNSKHTAFATAIEFIHTATLLHDDVVDMSTLRRGLPTANANWGNAPSVLVGDFIYSRAFQLLVRMNDNAAIGLMADTSNLIAEGEVMQLGLVGNIGITEAEYMQVIERKTAILFSAACQGAAIINQCEASLCDAMGNYGKHLGLAFQIVDDTLDYEGDSQALGKKVGDDFAEGKLTLPLIYALTQATTSEHQLIASAIENKQIEQFDDILAIIHRTQAMEYCHNIAQQQSRSAIAIARTALTPSPEADALIELASIAVSRDH